MKSKVTRKLLNIFKNTPWSRTHTKLRLQRVRPNGSDQINRRTVLLIDLQRCASSQGCTVEFQVELECGPMPNVMVALPNIGGALCSTPQSLADAHYYMPCSNDAKTRKPLKVAGVPQTPETISAASGPKFTILWVQVEEILLLNKFFSDCR